MYEAVVFKSPFLDNRETDFENAEGLENNDWRFYREFRSLSEILLSYI